MRSQTQTKGAAEIGLHNGDEGRWPMEVVA